MGNSRRRQQPAMAFQMSLSTPWDRICTYYMVGFRKPYWLSSLMQRFTDKMPFYTRSPPSDETQPQQPPCLMFLRVVDLKKISSDMSFQLSDFQD
ncbi:hypothetical protein llap_1254 [Limosa lapponica baueri]|uniref:Uncharacterized protein n=1 Tax=Limosa lapponica baueri TaxID=1758121 RepID=A0A2I0UQT8_LIMLA|nr:hypothetical protein llap_1254 [Limosa lapponica baueri]